MTSPKHLWSGDWESESASAAADRANLPAPPPVAEPEPPPRSPTPSTPGVIRTALGRLGDRLGDLRLPRLRPRQRRAALLVVLAALVIAGGAVALSSSGGSGPGAASASTPWLGLQMASVPVGRVLVAGVTPGSPADRAGVGVGDLILGVNGKPVSSPGDVDAAIDALRAGDRVKLEIERGPVTFTLPAKLTRQPAGYP